MMLNPQNSPLISDPYPVGLSDEEELRRMGLSMANSQGVGEVLIDYDGDIADLGLRSE